MRALFYYRIHFDDKAKAGPVNKCKAIVEAFRKHGIEGDTWHFTQNGLQCASSPELSLEMYAPVKTWRHLLLYYFISDIWLLKKVDFRKYDFVYIRHLPTHPMFILLLRCMKRQNPQLNIIVEMATFPYDKEYKGLINNTILCIDQVFRRKFKSYVDGIAHYGDPGSILGISAIPIQNGIEVSSVSLRKAPISFELPLQILAFGNWSHWHGLDRVLEGIKLYKDSGGEANILFKIVGNGPVKPQLLELVQKYGLADQVIFYEPKLGDELLSFFDEAHIAVGSLGLHRIHLEKATPLKHREYCARGIPFIFSSTDDDFPTLMPFVKQLPADDTPIDIEKLKDFAYHCYENSQQMSSEMRKYAEEHLDWEAKVKPIVVCFASLNGEIRNAD